MPCGLGDAIGIIVTFADIGGDVGVDTGLRTDGAGIGALA
jgi:hypothetical protein